MNSIMPAPGTRDGNWIWDGCRWVCRPDCDFDDRCPPFSILQPGGVHSPFFPPPVTQPPWYPGANGGVSFAPPGQPPPNPIRGAFWWDGTSLWLFDGATWDIVGAAAGGGPVTPPGTTFPPHPVPGEQFFDGKTLWVWDGAAWVPVSGTRTFIQATAPPSPNPGDLWFDGTQLRIWSGTAWELVGPGATVGPVPTTTQTFRIATATNHTILSDGSWVIAPIGASPTIDTQTAWDSASHKLTPKIPGIYFFTARAFYESPTALSSQVAIAKNDVGSITTSATIVAISAVYTQASEQGWMTCSTMVPMNGTTDFLRMWVSDTSGNFWVTAPLPSWEVFLLP